MLESAVRRGDRLTSRGPAGSLRRKNFILMAADRYATKSRLWTCNQEKQFVMTRHYAWVDICARVERCKQMTSDITDRSCSQFNLLLFAKETYATHPKFHHFSPEHDLPISRPFKPLLLASVLITAPLSSHLSSVPVYPPTSPLSGSGHTEQSR